MKWILALLQRIGELMGLTDNMAKVAYTSYTPTDKIIKTYTGTFVAASGGSGAANGTFLVIDSYTNSTVAVHSWFSQLIWSDDGTTWFPGGHPHNTLSAYNNNGMELTVIGVVAGGDVSVYAINQRPTTASIQYKMVIFDRSRASGDA